MKITNKTPTLESVRVASLPLGTVFVYLDSLYILTVGTEIDPNNRMIQVLKLNCLTNVYLGFDTLVVRHVIEEITHSIHLYKTL